MALDESYRQKVKPAAEAVACVRSGDHVWLHGGCNNPEELVKALVGRAGELRDVEVTHILTFGAADHVDPRYEGSFRDCSLFTGPNVRQAGQRGPGRLGAGLPVRDPRPRPLADDSGRRRVHPHLAARRARLLLLRRRCRVHEGGRRERAEGRRARQPADAALARRLVHPRLASHARGRDRPAAHRAARSAPRWARWRGRSAGTSPTSSRTAPRCRWASARSPTPCSSS